MPNSNTATNISAPVIEYSREVQSRAADEMGTLGPPCPRDAVYGECSAVHRFVIDYGWTRDRIRAGG